MRTSGSPGAGTGTTAVDKQPFHQIADIKEGRASERDAIAAAGRFERG